MDCYFGGAAQGKLPYVLKRWQLTEEQAADGACAPFSALLTAPVVYNFHLAIRRMMAQDIDAFAFVEQLASENPDCKIIFDEIGCGIVPLHKKDRQWRDYAGQVCTRLVEKCHTATRVAFGTGQVLK